MLCLFISFVDCVFKELENFCLHCKKRRKLQHFDWLSAKHELAAKFELINEAFKAGQIEEIPHERLRKVMAIHLDFRQLRNSEVRIISGYTLVLLPTSFE